MFWKKFDLAADMWQVVKIGLQLNKTYYSFVSEKTV